MMNPKKRNHHEEEALLRPQRCQGVLQQIDSPVEVEVDDDDG